MIIFLIVLFIALCAALHLWINRKRGLIAGEPIGRGSFVCIGADGKVHTATQCGSPLGICIGDSPTTCGNELNSNERTTLEDIKAAMDEIDDPPCISVWLDRQKPLWDMYAPSLKYWDDLQKEMHANDSVAENTIIAIPKNLWRIQ